MTDFTLEIFFKGIKIDICIFNQTLKPIFLSGGKLRIKLILFYMYGCKKMINNLSVSKGVDGGGLDACGGLVVN